MGYDTEWCVLGANDVGANHKRDRIWILAYTNSKSDAQRRFNTSISEISGQWSIDERRSGRNVDGISQSSTNEEMDTESGHTKRKLADTDLCGHLHGQTEIQSTDGRFNALSQFRSSSSDVANSCNERLQRYGKQRSINESKEFERFPRIGFVGGSGEWWKSEPNVGRVANGVAARVDRLKAIGNGQVPLCAATAWNILKGRIDGRS
jgi:DNA (cytosine-5)-methyltransferase 1